MRLLEVAGEEGFEVKGTAMERTEGSQRVALKASWMGLKEEEKRRGRRGGGFSSKEWVKVEGATIEGKGSWVGLEEKDSEENGVRRKGRKGKEWSLARKGWRGRVGS